MRALKVSNHGSYEYCRKLIEMHRKNGVYNTEIRKDRQHKPDYAVYLKRDNL